MCIVIETFPFGHRAEPVRQSAEPRAPVPATMFPPGGSGRHWDIAQSQNGWQLQESSQWISC